MKGLEFSRVSVLRQAEQGISLEAQKAKPKAYKERMINGKS